MSTHKSQPYASQLATGQHQSLRAKDHTWAWVLGRAAVGGCGPERGHLVQPGGISSRGEDRLLTEAEEEESDNISALDTGERQRA